MAPISQKRSGVHSRISQTPEIRAAPASTARHARILPVAIATLRGRTIATDWQVWKRDPTIYSGPILNGLFYLFLNRLRPTADLVDAAVARLEQVPRALEQATANLDPALAGRLILERGLGSAKAGAGYVRSMLMEEADTDAGRERHPLCSSGFRRWCVWITSSTMRPLRQWMRGCGPPPAVQIICRCWCRWLGINKYQTQLLRQQQGADDAQNQVYI